MSAIYVLMSTGVAAGNGSTRGKANEEAGGPAGGQ